MAIKYDSKVVVLTATVLFYYTQRVSAQHGNMVCPTLAPGDENCSDSCGKGCVRPGELCCFNGCAHSCVNALPPKSECQQMREGVLAGTIASQYVPRCESDGSFSLQQCHSSLNYCWCADPNTGFRVSPITYFKVPHCGKMVVKKLFCAYNARKGNKFYALIPVPIYCTYYHATFVFIYIATSFIMFLFLLLFFNT